MRFPERLSGGNRDRQPRSQGREEERPWEQGCVTMFRDKKILPLPHPVRLILPAQEQRINKKCASPLPKGTPR